MQNGPCVAITGKQDPYQEIISWRVSSPVKPWLVENTEQSVFTADYQIHCP